MNWSYSSARLFAQCQRKWLYKSGASTGGRLKDEARLRLRRLGQLSTISAWRGQIVDDVISRIIAPALENEQKVTLADAKNAARQLYNKQRSFAEAHKVEDLTLVKSAHKDAFCLFFEDVYGDGVTDEMLQTAWSEIEASLENLFSMDALKDDMRSGHFFVAQPPLHFNIVGELKGKAVPDLIIYTVDAPIKILDWKVHVEGANDARQQLASYAIALSRLEKPNRNFPDEDWQAPSSEIELIEAQLLLASVRPHKLNDDDIEDAERFMMASAYEMARLRDDRTFKDIDVLELDAASDPELCASCAFQSVCWETPRYA